ncbi:MAG TPA: adenylate/guanylate cyclase domain-containing protein, partial [Candidatus Limnocylindrales bacterium]
MTPCPTCGTQNPDRARFCAECGTALTVSRAGSTRKLATIVFIDAAGSTQLGETLDPETVRTLMARYFAVIRPIVEAHGGIVEKFIGDAVMAAFGIPVVHEDDALRAVRAAIEIRAALHRLDGELRAGSDATVRFRTGINTGEVVAGDHASGQAFATGDTVNTAARLESAAGPGDILIGRSTWLLVRDAVTAEPVAPIVAKGKAEPVGAYRLVGIDASRAGRERRLDRPMIGRSRELAMLREAFDGIVAERRCRLVTLLGTAGVGKSRLIAEFVEVSAPAATVLRGRCLSYGEGVTYWPIAEIIRAAAGILESETPADARSKLLALVGDADDAEIVTARVASAIGLSSDVAPQDEVFWGIRRLLEQIAGDRPLIVVIEDIHWAEPTLLDLIEHIADRSRDTAILLVCPARPELLDAHPRWGDVDGGALTITLEPLGVAATRDLIAGLPGGSALPRALSARLTAAAEGNPLFVEEFLGMLVDDGSLIANADGAWSAAASVEAVRMPPSVKALISARLERLAPDERAAAERASVVGRAFDEAAVAELTSDALRPTIGQSLLALVRKELVRPDRSELSAGDAFKFRHILIRDAAYEALPKSERAVLHERFAEWLAATVGERLPEFEEIVGYHLEQAHRYRTELGETGDAIAALADR